MTVPFKKDPIEGTDWEKIAMHLIAPWANYWRYRKKPEFDSPRIDLNSIAKLQRIFSNALESAYKRGLNEKQNSDL